MSQESVTPEANPPKPRIGLASAACLVVVLWGVKAAGDFFVPLLVASTLALTGMPLVRVMVKRHVPNWVAVGAASFLLVAPLALAAIGAVYQLQGFARDLPGILNSLDARLATSTAVEWAKPLGFAGAVTVADLGARLSESLGQGLQVLAVGLTLVATATSEAVLVVIFAMLMLAARAHLYRSAQALLARWEGVHVARMLEASIALVETFLLTKLLIAAVFGALSGLVLYAAGVPYSYLLGGIVGLMTLIPTIGFYLALLPFLAVVIATDVSWSHSATGLAGLFVLHLIEANVATPKFVGHTLNLNALATFVGLFAGGLLWGPWGMFLSVPILGVLRIVFSVSPSLVPWGDLLAERDDRELSASLVKKSLRAALARASRTRRPPLPAPTVSAARVSAESVTI